jgi:excisionase family DNA binding protein
MTQSVREVPTTVQKVALTPEEAAEALSISRSQMYILIAHDEIASITIGRLRRVPISALHEFILGRLTATRKAG